MRITVNRKALKVWALSGLIAFLYAEKAKVRKAK